MARYKRRFRKCELCGEMKVCERRPNPYKEELYGDRQKEWMCDDCFEHACFEI
jgi:hypothetical protein